MEGLIFTQLGEQPDGAGGDAGVLFFEQSGERGNGGGALCFQPIKAGVAHVDRGALECGDLSLGRGEIDLRHDGFKAFGGDSVNGAAHAFVEGAVASNPTVEPVGDIEGSVGTDGDVTGAEHGLEFPARFAAEEVGSGELALFVRSDEIDALELEACSVPHGEITENDVFPGFAGEEESFPFFTEGTVLVVSDAGG